MSGEFVFFSDPERLRRGIEAIRGDRKPISETEEKLARTLNPDQLAIEGLDIVLRDPPEAGWKLKPKK